MTLDDVFGDLRKLAGKWQADAVARRSLWADDPVAATLSHAAAELITETTRMSHETSRLKVKDFAELRGVNPATVRRWIRVGYLSASKGSNGYTISRTAKVARVKAA